MKADKTRNDALDKLAKAAGLIKEAALQFEEAGLDLDFQIIVKAQRPTLYCMAEFGENDPPSK